MDGDTIGNERTIDNGDTIGNERTIPAHAGSALGHIDQYELLKELGGGGFGTVYLAKDTVSGIEVAVKGLPPFVRNNREEMENIRSNFALVSRLTHTNIAKALVLHPAKEVVYESEDVRKKLRVDSGDTLMVMDYAPGVTLSQWRRQFPDRKVPLEQALEITRQIASALDYAHELRVVHRDIKPANMMIETAEDGSVKVRVLDFGLAAEIRSSMGRVSREIHDTSGTRPYMAPEQWLGAKQGPATDQYSLAAMFCELVTGDVPFASVFDTGDPVVMMNAVGREPFAPSQDLPKPIRLALSKALAKRPEERFASCGDFVAALEGKGNFSRKERKGNKGEASDNGGAGKIVAAVVLVAAMAGAGYFGLVKYDEGVRAREAERTRIAAEKTAEAKRIKQEVYELKGKASQAREKNAKEEWHKWPHFGVKAKELEGAFRAGEAAFAKDDFEVARMQFLKVRDNWYWLSSNKVERVKAIAAKGMAEESRRNAEVAKAGMLSPDEFSAATNGFAIAASAFDSGAFHVSEEAFSKAKLAFEKATAMANAENERLMAQRKKADTEAALAAWRDGRHAEAVRLSKTSDLSNFKIQCYLGLAYRDGNGVEKNLEEAFKWFMKAAVQDVAIAQYEIGSMYYNGFGINKDVAEAVRWYRKAADQGYVEAQNKMGFMYKKGSGVEKNGKEAIKWFTKAAEQKHVRAMAHIGTIYEEGNGVVEDKNEALKWFRKAAEAGFSFGMSKVGQYYRYGIGGVEENHEEAVKWFNKANDVGDEDAPNFLGEMYEKGQGVKKDVALAKKFYAIAAQRGNEDAKVASERLAATSLTYEEALKRLGVDLDYFFPKDKIVRVSASEDLKKAIEDCQDGGTLMLSAGSYSVAETTTYLPRRRIRIVGVRDQTIINANICQGTRSSPGGLVLSLENLTIIAKNNDKYTPESLSGAPRGIMCVKNCRFKDGGIYINNNSKSILSDIIIENAKYSRAITVDNNAKVAIIGARILGADANFLYVFAHSKVYGEKLWMSGAKEEGIRTNGAGVCLFFRDCDIRDVTECKYNYQKIGIKSDDEGVTYLDDVRFINCPEAAFEIDGKLDYHGVKVNSASCGKGALGKSDKMNHHDTTIPLAKDFFE